MAAPYDLLEAVLHEVRAGKFAPDLLERAKSLRADCALFLEPVEEDEVSFGRAYSLLWEVHDQAGKYREAFQSVAEIAKQYLKDMRKADPLQYRLGYRLPDEKVIKNRQIGRQKVMCCLAYAFALYRLGHESYQDSAKVFDECQVFLKSKLIDADAASRFSCWGALARLYYFQSQLHRSKRDFADARELAGKSLDCARARLEEKAATVERLKELVEHLKRERQSASDEELSTAIDELGGASAKLKVEQVFANHCAGKVLAFGFGWTALLEGELSRAEEYFQAARILLRDCDDTFLKSQVELLSCSARRARSGFDSELLQRTRKCCAELSGHPVYSLQAKHQLVVALLAAATEANGRQRSDGRTYLIEAWQIVATVRKDETIPLSSWVLATVTASRIARALARPEAQSLAREAYGKAPLHDSTTRAEAAIALGESLSVCENSNDWRKFQRDLREAASLFEIALELSPTNRVVRCACYLHLTAIHLKLNKITQAATWFRCWETDSAVVQHSWLRDKANELGRSLRQTFVIDVDKDDPRSLRQFTDDLERFLLYREQVRQSGNKKFVVSKAAKNLKAAPKKIGKWMLRFGEHK